MRTFIKITSDTTLYQNLPTVNSGYDEIIEVGKVVDLSIENGTSVSSSARALLKFPIDSIEEHHAHGHTYPVNDHKVFLNLRLANATELQFNQKLEVGLVSRSWDEGSGYYYQREFNAEDGATWLDATKTVSWTHPGGDFISSHTASITLDSYPLEDVRVDITDMMFWAVSASINWNGIYVRFPTADEQNPDVKGNIKFFSAQTHTIYQPTIEVCHLGQEFITGSLRSITTGTEFSVTTTNLETTYKKGSIQQVKLLVRDRYPDRLFNDSLRYKNKYYLPENSSFRIVDVAGGTAYGDFDEYNTINCNTTGSYFQLDTTELNRYRTYKIELKLIFPSGEVKFITLPTEFTVE